MDGSVVPEVAIRQETPQERVERASGLKRQATISLREDNPFAAVGPAQEAAGLFESLALSSQMRLQAAQKKQTDAAEESGREENTGQVEDTREDWLKFLGLGGRSHAIAAKAYEAIYRKNGDVENLDFAIYELTESLAARRTIAAEKQKESPLVLPRRKLGRLLFERAQIAYEKSKQVEESNLRQEELKKARDLFFEARNVHFYNVHANIADIPTSHRHSLFQREVMADFTMAEFGFKAMQKELGEDVTTTEPEEKLVRQFIADVETHSGTQVIRGTDGQDKREIDRSFERAKWLSRLQTRYGLLLLHLGRTQVAEQYIRAAGQVAIEYNESPSDKPLPDDHLQFIAQAQEQFRQAVSAPPAVDLTQVHLPEVSQ